ncbi:hypothetical protein TNCV_4910571 [Trichonephila clavipes]|nr:hypothetical protein TNCV_4910571 [Trichonephila clavipes]
MLPNVVIVITVNEVGKDHSLKEVLEFLNISSSGALKCSPYEIKAHEIDRGKGLVGRLLISVALSTIQVTVQFGSVFHLNFEGEHPEDGQRSPTSPLHPPTSQKDLRLESYLEYHHAAM